MKKTDSGPNFPEPPERLIRKLSELLKANDLAEIELASGDLRLKLRARESAAIAPMPVSAMEPVAAPVSKAEANASSASDLHIIRSPFVGTFYRAPSPQSAAYVEEGQAISKGNVLCIVEAMKIMNEIESDSAGVVEKIYVEDGTPVDFNTALFGVRKT